VAVATAVATAAGCGSGRSSTQEVRPTPGLREVTVPWRLVAVRDAGHVLVLRYRAGGCLRGDGHAIVAETDDRVLIHVHEHQQILSSRRAGAGPKEACTGEIRLKTLRVSLQKPLAGKAVTGGPHLTTPSNTAARPLP
jgi:hypothetical protein